ncbi:MAG: hypothetical protein V1784_07475 [bacterium]
MEEENQKKQLAFVLMPLGPEFNGMYKDLIVPALESEGFEVGRADGLLRQQGIVRSATKGITHADLIVADLTSLDQTVLYELGIAHGLLKPTVLIAQSIEDVPFDLRSYNAIVYSTRYSEVQKLQDNLRAIARKVSKEKMALRSPISDFAQDIDYTTFRGEKEQAEVQQRPVPEADASKRTPQHEERGQPDLALEVEQSGREMGALVEKIGEPMQMLRQKIEERTSELGSVKGLGMVRGEFRRRKIAKRMARDMLQCSWQMKVWQPKFHGSWERFVQSIMRYLYSLDIGNVEDRQEAMVFRSEMQDFQKDLGLFIKQNRGFHLSEMRGTSRALDFAVQVTERAVNGVIEEFVIADSNVTQVLNLIRKKVEEVGNTMTPDH